MTTAAPSTALATIQPAFTDAERLALAGFLAGYRGLTREAYALDLRQFTTWCRVRSLALFAVRRAEIESFARELEARGRARATVTRRLSTITASLTVYKVSMTQRAMQEATFLILTALADSSQHGYGIITEVQEISGGRVRLRAGTLYTALDRLRADGLIEVDREEIVEGLLRRYYGLTPEGTRRLAAEAARLQANATTALTRLKPLGVVT